MSIQLLLCDKETQQSIPISGFYDEHCVPEILEVFECAARLNLDVLARVEVYDEN